MDPHAALGIGAWPRESSTVLARTSALPSQARPGTVIRTGSSRAGAPLEFAPHAHALDELVWVRGGTMTAQVEGQILTIPQGRALWLPAGVTHAGRLTANAELFDAFFDPDRAAGRTGPPASGGLATPPGSPAPDDPAAQPGSLAPAPAPAPALADVAVLEMTPVLEELLLHLARPDLEPGPRARAEAVVLDLLAPLPQPGPLALPLPADPRIGPVVAAILADPADRRDLAAWARELGVGERTLTRAFRSSTGLAFAQWRQMVRVHRALALLGEGEEVQEVAALLGYRQPSTFIAAFRRVMGVPPGAFAAGTRQVAGKP